jgi:hypothetical protein
MFSEVFKQDTSVFAYITKVHSLSTSLEEEQAIEVLKERRVRLMNRAQLFP